MSDVTKDRDDNELMLIAMESFVEANETSAEEGAAFSTAFVAGWRMKRELDRMEVDPKANRALLLKAVDDWVAETGGGR